MDIAALSVVLASSNARGSASIAVASKIKEITEQNGANLLAMMNTSGVMENSVSPHIGGNIDIKL